MAETFSYGGDIYTIPSGNAQSSNGQLKVEIGFCSIDDELKIAVRFTHNNPLYDGRYYCPSSGDGVGFGTGGPRDGRSHQIKFNWSFYNDGFTIQNGTIDSINVEKNTPQIIVLTSGKNIRLSSLDFTNNYYFHFGWDDSVLYTGVDGNSYRGYYGWDSTSNQHVWVNLNFNLNLNFPLSSATNSQYSLEYSVVLDNFFEYTWASSANWQQVKLPETPHLVLDAPTPNDEKHFKLTFKKGEEKKEKAFTCKYTNGTPVFLHWQSSRSLEGIDRDTGTFKEGIKWLPGDKITSNFLGGTVSLTSVWYIPTELYSLTPYEYDLQDATNQFSNISNYHGWLNSNGVIYPLSGAYEFVSNETFSLTTESPNTDTDQVWIKTESGWKKGSLWVKTSDTTWSKSQRAFVKTNSSSWQSS